MTDKTEKQASPGPFDDKNLGELFQIALVNAPSPSKNAFNWGAFKPEAVKSPADLPPYLVFGPLNEGTFLLTPEGWRAEWSDAQQKAKITLNWGANTHRYTATQVWEGEEGSASGTARYHAADSSLCHALRKRPPIHVGSAGKEKSRRDVPSDLACGR